jgi:hypothetical protein
MPKRVVWRHVEDNVATLQRNGAEVAEVGLTFTRAHTFSAGPSCAAQDTVALRYTHDLEDVGRSTESVRGPLLALFVLAINAEMPALIRRVRKSFADMRAGYARQLRLHAQQMIEGAAHDELPLAGTREDDWIQVDLQEARRLTHFLGPDVIAWVANETDVVRAMPDTDDHANRGACFTRPQYQTAAAAMETMAAEENRRSERQKAEEVDIPF